MNTKHGKNMPRITILTGHFGSGKTEISLNYSINMAREGIRTILIDLDIVNPFFRSTEVKHILAGEGVQLISPTFASTTVDVPSLPAEIYSVFQAMDSNVVFDVGGDETGARALGRYYPYFKRESYQMLYVINTRRPLSANKEDILDMINLIELKSRLKVTHLVNNTNISHETTLYDIMEGQAICEDVSENTGIPVSYISGVRELISNLPAKYKDKAFPLELYMKPPW